MHGKSLSARGRLPAAPTLRTSDELHEHAMAIDDFVRRSAWMASLSAHAKRGDAEQSPIAKEPPGELKGALWRRACLGTPTPPKKRFSFPSSSNIILNTNGRCHFEILSKQRTPPTPREVRRW